LAERFGGLTAFTRWPAQGTTTESGRPVHDEIVVFEVMTEALDVSWEATGSTSSTNFAKIRS
jgi:hypothetical protein